MNIRKLLLVPALAILLTIGNRTAAAERPNIVVIAADDQTYSDFGFMGHAHVRTPHLDRLAAQSARYLHGYVPASVCRPSLATLLTGLYPHQHGIHFNHPPPGFAKLRKLPFPERTAALHAATSLIESAPTLPRTHRKNRPVVALVGMGARTRGQQIMDLQRDKQLTLSGARPSGW